MSGSWLLCNPMNHLRSRMLKRIVKVVAIVASASVAAWSASPCDGVNRTLPVNRRMALAPVIAKQLHFQGVDVLRSFQFGDWGIFDVDTHETDETYVFYAHDPRTSHYVALWSGAARNNEERAINAWTLKNAPRIPHRLATCFAWHVTKASQ
jgi:hypothetical protein